MIINEKQILQLVRILELLLDDNLSEHGKDTAQLLIDDIVNQQSEELKVIE